LTFWAPADDRRTVRGARLSLVFSLVAGCLLAGSAKAQQADAGAPTAPVDDAKARGRDAFLRGVELARERQKWGDALSAFQEAAGAHDAPMIQFNIAYCQRALGRYAEARRTLRRIAANPAGLDAAQIEDSKAYLAEIEQILVRVSIRLEPALASLTVDGRSLAPDDAEADVYVPSSGPAKPIDRSAFVVILDPGAHLFRATRPGHQDAFVNRTYGPGEHASLDLHLDLLPATVVLRSDPAQSIVTLDRRELGVAPMEFQRAAGRYKLEVALTGFETYRATLDLEPGQHVDLTAKLNERHEPLTAKWWFWTGAGVLLAGAAAITYAVTRPAPQPPPYDPGTAGWLVHAQLVR
jgi:hypothetical protein